MFDARPSNAAARARDRRRRPRRSPAASRRRRSRKRIDYKSDRAARRRSRCRRTSTTPRYDDRYNVTTAIGLAAQSANRPRAVEGSPSTRRRTRGSSAPATSAGSSSRRRRSRRGTRCASSGTTSASCSRSSNRTIGVMETDWAENRAEIPSDGPRGTIGKYIDIFYTTLQARQVPHAHRARHRARHRRDLHFASRHGAGADDARSTIARRRRSPGR